MYRNNVGAQIKDQKGITLIALVITIIVMLILVSVTISMAVNGGLFEKAGEAVSKTDEALNAEQALSEGKIQINGAWYDSIDKYLSEEKSFESYPEYSTSLLDAKTGVLTENTKYTDANKEVAVIPKGFYLTNVEDEINEGIVIEDANENQFVWVPVEEGTFERATTNTTYIENASNDPTGEYVKMVASVNKYGGFYIGRYEAGSVENRQEDGTTTPGTTTLGVRKGLYPYNMVCWGTSMTEYDVEREYTSGSTTYDYGYGAVYLSKTMYTGNAYGAISTLCYGIQWDAVSRFIADDVNISNTAQWANVYSHQFTFSGEYSTDGGITWDDEETEKPEGIPWLLTTGASETNKAKNIYDLAGNAGEWTMEAKNTENTEIRLLRGGSIISDPGPLDKLVDMCSLYLCYSNVAFRPTLYIK